MKQNEKKKIAVGFGVLLCIALLADLSAGNGSIQEIARGAFGEIASQQVLYLEVENMESEYPYHLEIMAQRPTAAQAEEYFAEAIAEIEAQFGQIEDRVPFQESYVDGIVEAEWYFYPLGIIHSDGSVEWDKISDEGCNITAETELSCGTYKKRYTFSFVIMPKAYSQEEKILQAIQSYISKEQEKEGTEILHLPTEIDGVRLNWKKREENLTFKILVLEVMAGFALWYADHQKKRQEEQKLREVMELEYPEITSQLMLLVGAGVNIRQAWNRISARYLDKRQKNIVKESPAYEAILAMDRQLREGENERIAYQKFAETTKTMSYYRLVRLLIGNQEKGTGGLCEALEQENRQAYETRILRAKKLGEEASTKMILPLLLLMGVVMAIVTLPAMLGFSI